MYLHTYMHAYTHTHTHTHTHKHIFHGSLGVSPRQQDVEQAINTQKVQNFYNVKYYKHFTKQYYASLHIKNSYSE